MNFRVQTTDQFEQDLNRTLDYIEFTLKNSRAADDLLDEAEHTVASLSQMPERYALAGDELLASWGIRLVRVKNYLAFYTVDRETQTVQVIRFLYGKSDWRSILQEQHDSQ